MEMKASLKLRAGGVEGGLQKPLVKAKLPFDLLGLPFFSGITVGNSQELALRLGTYQETGPCFEIAYRPNDADRPVSLVMKTGFGPWGSSAGAALAMAAEFNLSTPGNPSFRLWVKPQVGDFSIKREFRSASRTASESHHEGTLAREENLIVPERNVDGPEMGFSNSFARDTRQATYDNEGLSTFSRDLFGRDSVPMTTHRDHGRNDRIDVDWEHLADTVSSSRSSSNVDNVSQQVREAEETELRFRSSSNASQGWGICDLLAGCQLRARSSLTISKQAQLQVRWRMQATKNFSQALNAPFTLPLLPLLVLDKISVQAVSPLINDLENSSSPSFSKAPEIENDQKVAQLETMFFSMKDTLRSIELENAFLKRTMENVREEGGIKSGGSRLGQKSIIEHPIEVGKDGEVKLSPFLRDYVDGKRLMD